MCGLVLASLLAVTVPAPAADADKDPQKAEVVRVTVVSVSGQAQKLLAADEKGKWEPLGKGDVLDERTIIRTGFRTKVVLKFADRGEVTIRRATKVGISECRKEGTLVRTRLGLKYGTIRAAIEIARGPSDFKVSTPVATLSVRGCAGEVVQMGDTGTNVRSTAGRWRMAGMPGLGRRPREVKPGERGNSRFIPHINLVMQNLDTQVGEAGRGLSGGEKKNRRNHGGGRGIIGFTGSRTGSAATVSVQPVTQETVVGPREPGHP